jgi:hypothetical protein
VVPPAADAVAEPFAPPKQETLLLELMEAESGVLDCTQKLVACELVN